MSLSPGQIAFAALTAVSVGQLLFLAPSGRVLTTTPAAQHATRDPSIRAGSAGTHTSWFFWSGGGSGGYHGGK